MSKDSIGGESKGSPVDENSDAEVDLLANTFPDRKWVSPFAWMGDVIDANNEIVGTENSWLPQRPRAKALQIPNYKPTIDSYTKSLAPAYNYASSRTKKKKTKKIRTDEDESESIVSPAFGFQATDALGTNGKDAAHHIPHDTGCAVFYEAPVVGALGKELDKNSQPKPMNRIEKQSLIHGSMLDNIVRRTDIRPLQRRLRKRKNKSSTDQPEKKKHSGIKHCALNKIQLLNHESFDHSPYMILAPALKVDQILDWTPGTPYNIICLVGNVESDYVTTDDRMSFDRCGFAKRAHVKAAIESLRVFVLGLAETLRDMEDFDALVALAKQKDNLEKKDLEPLEATRNHLKTKDTIKTPTFNREKFREIQGLGLGVAMISLHDSIPDPYLMCVKAAVNWSYFHDQSVLKKKTIPSAPLLMISTPWNHPLISIYLWVTLVISKSDALSRTLRSIVFEGTIHGTGKIAFQFLWPSIWRMTSGVVFSIKTKVGRSVRIKTRCYRFVEWPSTPKVNLQDDPSSQTANKKKKTK